MADIFHEVDEEVRRERLKKLWDRYGLYILALAVLVVGAVGGWRAYSHFEAKKAAEAGAAFEAANALADADKPQEAADAFAKLAKEGTAGYRTLARLREAAELAERDQKAAVALFDQVAADASVPGRLRDLAALRAGLLLLDSASYPDIQSRIEPLAAPDRTFRHSAREMLAIAAWRANDASAARRWAEMIASDVESPATIRQRVEMLLALLPPAAKG
ncbi:MAG: tetratricopeptide repeat protein [Pseudorhodoplanes sp.]|nr:tetratricopeptide repeat protein [Pseudorhodoplanes sp.]